VGRRNQRAGFCARRATAASAASLRHALAPKGWLIDVRAAVAGADPLTQELWAAANEISVDDPMVAAVAAAIGKTPDDVLAVFQLAETYM
jgi:hypothetical protein